MRQTKRYSSWLWAAAILVAVGLGPVSRAMAYGTLHADPDRQTPWSNCALCHDLTGSAAIPPSCTNCHNDFSDPNPPPIGHNLHTGHTSFGIDDRLDPITNCAFCHGQDLTGGIGQSCFNCHDQVWPGGGDNSPPVIDTGGPYAAAPGDTVLLDASGTTDPDGDDLTFLWLVGDGTPPQLPSSNPVKSHVYVDEGTYTALLTVLDGHNVTDPVEVQVVISASGGGGNASPTADPGGPYSATAGQAVAFDGSASSDTDGTIASYDWDFGDGGTGTGATPTHTYATVGSYTVTLTVTDDGGATDTATDTATVTAVPNEAPFADHGGPYSGTTGQAVSLDASASFDSDGTIVSWAWDFGDSNVGAGEQTTHTYASSGTYTVTLTVTDDEGATDEVTTTAAITDVSSNVPPVADAGGPYSGVVGQAVQFDGSGSSDSDGSIVAYLWTFGDNGVGTGTNPSHTYAAAGTYTVELILMDNGGGTDSATVTVEITEPSDPGTGPGPLPDGDSWNVLLPLAGGQLQVTFSQYGGFLFVHEYLPDGTVLTGIGMESYGSLLWMDSSGAIFFGNINRWAGTMQGLVFNYFGSDSLWVGEQPRWPGGGGAGGSGWSNGGLFGMGMFGFGSGGGNGMGGNYGSGSMGSHGSYGGSPMGGQSTCGGSSAPTGPRTGYNTQPRSGGTTRYRTRGWW